MSDNLPSKSEITQASLLFCVMAVAFVFMPSFVHDLVWKVIFRLFDIPTQEKE